MSYNYFLPESIDLYVADRISKSDANRQDRTARSILSRLEHKPGIILADEVGMGKTFVALAVAISVFLKEKKPVVIMIPPNLIKKWPGDFELFKEACIKDEKIRERLNCGEAQRPEQLFKFLDDDIKHRKAVIFLTHGALTRNLSDSWIKLAIIQRAIYRRKGSGEIYKSLAKHAGVLLEMKNYHKKNPKVKNIWELLLDKSPDQWRKILCNNYFEDEKFDDPVPMHFINELNRMQTSELNDLKDFLFAKLPKRSSENIDERLKEVRQRLNSEAKEIWIRCMNKMRLNLPLLIFDEAHHLKNSQTQLVTRLFHNPIAEEDAGFLTGQFERMLFLTATPFQLGHQELYRVLQRFETINWKSRNAPDCGFEKYRIELEELLRQLDTSQIAARKLDYNWGRLTPDDLIVDGKRFNNVFDWWQRIISNNCEITPNSKKVIEDYYSAKEKLKAVEVLLKRHVIRHLKQRELSDEYMHIKRRECRPGRMILEGNDGTVDPGGLDISNNALLPFLLAARLTTIHQDKRPVFAEGLASSYEAFRYTRLERMKKNAGVITDTDDDFTELPEVNDTMTHWYLEQLDGSLSLSEMSGTHHPKIKPTVDKAIELWSKGEKVLIFCHYIATAKALRKYISNAMREEIRIKGCQLLKCESNEVIHKLENLADRITDKDSKPGKKCLQILNEILDDFNDLSNLREDFISAVLRYMRTPSFLVRYIMSIDGGSNEDIVDRAFETTDNSGIAFRQVLISFCHFLTKRREDREDYIAALKSIQPGGIRGKDINLTLDDEDLKDDSATGIYMANVRLCYGATKQEFRQKLMKTFNTPFFPDILITSSVMGEGVDLHLNCRHIIHHDLCWNPSTLEQRTGRVDRIGAKAEKCGKPIVVYLPYISETQDEKMYKVVTERERWFNVIMGEKYKVDALSTDNYSERIPLPDELSAELSFNLSV